MACAKGQPPGSLSVAPCVRARGVLTILSGGFLGTFGRCGIQGGKAQLGVLQAKYASAITHATPYNYTKGQNSVIFRSSSLGS